MSAATTRELNSHSKIDLEGVKVLVANDKQINALVVMKLLKN